MNFIKTKDGIYKVIDTYEVKYVIGYTEDGFEINIYKEDVIKQANTPWELCDGFVIKENHHVVECRLKKDGWTLDDVIRTTKVETYEIVCFIETESGLIYVAKMNNEGKLCLI